MKKSLLIGAFAAISLFYACGEDVPPEPDKNNNQTDTTQNDTIKPDPCAGIQVTYIQISEIISNSCFGGCHDIGAAGISLNNYAQVKNATENSTLILAVKHASGVSPMPKGRPKLSDAQIQLIECWKAKGYPEN